MFACFGKLVGANGPRNRARKKPVKIESKEEKKSATAGKKEEDEEIVPNWEEKVDTFDELHLKEELLRGVYGCGFSKPSPIQQKCILPLIKKRDTIAQFGMEKTTAFVIAALQLVEESSDKVQCLIITLIDELAIQITRTVADLGEYMKVKVQACINSCTIEQDIINLKNGAQIVVATPGKLNDLIKGTARHDQSKRSRRNC